MRSFFSAWRSVTARSPLGRSGATGWVCVTPLPNCARSILKTRELRAAADERSVDRRRSNRVRKLSLIGPARVNAGVLIVHNSPRKY